MEPQDIGVSRAGRLEDVAQLSRTIHHQIRVQKVVAFKPMWWLSSMNQHRNDLTGKASSTNLFTALERQLLSSIQHQVAKVTKNMMRIL